MKSDPNGNHPATRADVKEIVTETVYDVITQFWVGQIKPELDKRPIRDEFDKEFRKIDFRLTKIEAGIKNNGREIRSVQLDTPSQNEFNRLEKRVTHLETNLSN